MNIISRLFSFLSGKKCDYRSEDNIGQFHSSAVTPTEKHHESGVFCRESRVDQVVSPYSKILTVNSDIKHEESERNANIITRTLDRWNPETCVRLLRMPSVQNYSGLCKLISESDKKWMIEFLDMGGLQVLFESVDRLSSSNSHSSRLERTLLLLQCVKCLKAVINSQTALRHIIQQRTYVQKIAEVLSSSNPLVKKQLFDFMSTLCIFSEGGHYLTLDVFESFRTTQKLRYRFVVLMIEIKQAEVIPYVGAVLGLMNCIVLGACGFRFRTRLRNEFLALGLQDLLESLKQIPDEEVELQCSVFLKSQLADEEYARSMGIHSSFSHFGLFEALLDKIEDTPLSASFLVVLQNLNQLDPTDRKTDYIWSALEEITERALSGAGWDLRNWMLNECRRNSLKSTATQTVFFYAPYLSMEDNQKSSLYDEDYEKDSVKSFSSHDSGVPVSRNQSFASNCPRSQENILLKQKYDMITETFLNTDTLDNITYLSESEVSSIAKDRISVDGKEKTNSSGFTKAVDLSIEPVSFDFTNKHTQTDSPSKTSPLSPISQNIVLADEGKTKKTFSFSFFNRSKKYSLTKCTNTVKVNHPSPDMQQPTSSKKGLTSIDVKRSRNQTRNCDSLLHDSSFVTFEGKSIISENDFQKQSSSFSSSFSTGEECKILDSKEHFFKSTSDNKQTILPPPPPPPPPLSRSPQVTFRPKSQQSLELPASKNFRASWSGNAAAKEFEKVEKRQHNTLPMPKSKMKTLNWTKIPTAHVSVHSIWSEISHESETMELNFEEMEKLFCQNEPRRKEPKLRQRTRVTSEVSLLDSKRSLSIHVFLKQFKGGLEEVIELVKQFKHKEIGAEKLRCLLHLLPDSNEVKLLNSYSGEVNRLGTAEKFLVQLIAIEHYDCLIEGMLLLEEFPTTLQSLHDSVQSLLDACQELLTNTGFKNFLKLILVTGNFMNTGSYAGNAVGFRLSTLPKLMETRANKPRITLLHYLVEETQRKCPHGINFTNHLLDKLNRCSRASLESLSVEITQLDNTMQKLNSQIEAENGKLKKCFSGFIENGIKHINILKNKMKEINVLSVQLANRFCEDEKKFQLEECLKVVGAFCSKIKIADSENQARKKADEKKT